MARVATVARDDAGGASSADESGPISRLGRAWQLLRRDATDGVVGVRLLDSSPGPVSVDPVQLDMLDRLVARDGQRMSELATAMRVDPSTVTRAMHRMEAAGLATRRPVPGDGRVVTAHLTAEGRRVHGIVAARRADLIRAAMADFTPEEQERLADLVERFLASIGAGAATSGPQPTAAG